MSKAAELAALIGSGQAQGNKNFVINGDMQCWQRATAATAASNTYSTVDRWALSESTDGAYTSERSTDTPTGTGYSLKLQVTTADTSIAAAQYSYILHEIEAQNLQSLQYGTSSAKTLTLSFWVKSNKTGTYTISIQKRDATVYYLAIEYTIDSANTWEKKTITISPTAGSTSFITASAGAIANDNGQGIQLGFGLAWGSQFNGATNNTWTTSTYYATSNHVNWMDSTDNNFYLAQVQLEIGDVATAFEHEDFATTLAKCQRYLYRRNFEIYDVVCQGAALGNKGSYCLHLPVAMRAKPACSQGSGIYCWYNQAGSITTQTGLAVTYMGTNDTNMTQAFIRADDNSTAASATNYPLGLTSYDGSGTNSTFIQLDAEL